MKTKISLIILGLILMFSGPWITFYLEGLTGAVMPSNATGFGISMLGGFILVGTVIPYLFKEE